MNNVTENDLYDTVKSIMLDNTEFDEKMKKTIYNYVKDIMRDVYNDVQKEQRIRDNQEKGCMKKQYSNNNIIINNQLQQYLWLKASNQNTKSYEANNRNLFLSQTQPVDNYLQDQYIIDAVFMNSTIPTSLAGLRKDSCGNLLAKDDFEKGWTIVKIIPNGPNCLCNLQALHKVTADQRHLVNHFYNDNQVKLIRHIIRKYTY